MAERGVQNSVCTCRLSVPHGAPPNQRQEARSSKNGWYLNRNVAAGWAMAIRIRHKYGDVWMMTWQWWFTAMGRWVTRSLPSVPRKRTTRVVTLRKELLVVSWCGNAEEWAEQDVPMSSCRKDSLRLTVRFTVLTSSVSGSIPVSALDSLEQYFCDFLPMCIISKLAQPLMAEKSSQITLLYLPHQLCTEKNYFSCSRFKNYSSFF